jgi:hypothetical protein
LQLNFSFVFPEEPQEVLMSLWFQSLHENPPDLPYKGMLGQFSSVLVVEGLVYALMHLQGLTYDQARDFLLCYE